MKNLTNEGLRSEILLFYVGAQWCVTLQLSPAALTKNEKEEQKGWQTNDCHLLRM